MAIFFLVSMLAIVAASMGLGVFVGKKLDRRDGSVGKAVGAFVGFGVGVLLVMATFYEGFFDTVRIDFEPAPGFEGEWVVLVYDPDAPAKLERGPFDNVDLVVPASGVVRLSDLDELLGGPIDAFMPNGRRATGTASVRLDDTTPPFRAVMFHVADDGLGSNEPPADETVVDWVRGLER